MYHKFFGSGRYSTIGAGRALAASGYYSTVSGGYSNTASGYYSTVSGGRSNTASGYYSTVSGGRSNAASSNCSTVSGGYSNTASSNYSTVSGGYSNAASSYYSTVSGGYSNAASSYCSTVSGGRSNTASGYYSTVSGGYGALASRVGERAHASKFFSAQGDAQQIELVLTAKTAAVTPVLMHVDGPSGTTSVAVPSGHMLGFSVRVCGIKSDGSQAAMLQRSGIIANVGGTTALVGAVQIDSVDINAGVYAVVITANNTTGMLDITVTGLALTTIRWVAHLHAVEIAYGV